MERIRFEALLIVLIIRNTLCLINTQNVLTFLSEKLRAEYKNTSTKLKVNEFELLLFSCQPVVKQPQNTVLFTTFTNDGVVFLPAILETKQNLPSRMYVKVMERTSSGRNTVIDSDTLRNITIRLTSLLQTSKIKPYVNVHPQTIPVGQLTKGSFQNDVSMKHGIKLERIRATKRRIRITSRHLKDMFLYESVKRPTISRFSFEQMTFQRTTLNLGVYHCQHFTVGAAPVAFYFVANNKTIMSIKLSGKKTKILIQKENIHFLFYDKSKGVLIYLTRKSFHVNWKIFHLFNMYEEFLRMDMCLPHFADIDVKSKVIFYICGKANKLQMFQLPYGKGGKKTRKSSPIPGEFAFLTSFDVLSDYGVLAMCDSRDSKVRMMNLNTKDIVKQTWRKGSCLKMIGPGGYFFVVYKQSADVYYKNGTLKSSVQIRKQVNEFISG